MRKTILAAALLGGLLFTAGATLAGEPGDALTELVGELEHRRDDDLSGDLDKAGKKQLKAIKKSLKAITKAGDDLKKCVKAGGKVAATLQKAFPEEIGTPDLESHVLDLGNLVRGWLWELERDIDDALNAADAARQVVSEKSVGKIDQQVEKADEALDLAEAPATFKDWGKALKQASGAALKALKAASKGGAPVSGPDSTSCVFGTGDFDAQVTVVEVCSGSTGFVLIARDHERGSYDRELVIEIEMLDENDGADLLGETASAEMRERLHGSDDAWRVFAPIAGGQLTITTWDPPRLIEGTFSFLSTDGEVLRGVSSGTFSVSGDAITVIDCE